MIGSASVAIGPDHVGVTGASTGVSGAVSRADSGAGARRARVVLERIAPMPRQTFSAGGADGVAAAFEALAGASIAGVGVGGIDETVATARLTTNAGHRIAEETVLASVTSGAVKAR